MNENTDIISVQVLAILSLKVLMEQSGWYKGLDILEVIALIENFDELLKVTSSVDGKPNYEEVINLRLDPPSKEILKVCVNYGLDHGLIKLTKDMRTLITFLLT